MLFVIIRHLPLDILVLYDNFYNIFHSLTLSNTPRSVSASNQNISQQSPHEGGAGSSTQDPGGHLTTALAAGNEKQLAVRKCRADYFRCLDLSRSEEGKSNITGRVYSSINIKSGKIHCKIRNCIYFLTCKNCGILYISESITPVNVRVIIHGKGKSDCELCISTLSVLMSILMPAKVPVSSFIFGKR